MLSYISSPMLCHSFSFSYFLVHPLSCSIISPLSSAFSYILSPALSYLLSHVLSYLLCHISFLLLHILSYLMSPSSSYLIFPISSSYLLAPLISFNLLHHPPRMQSSVFLLPHHLLWKQELPWCQPCHHWWHCGYYHDNWWCQKWKQS